MVDQKPPFVVVFCCFDPPHILNPGIRIFDILLGLYSKGYAETGRILVAVTLEIGYQITYAAYAN
jgi:hypothetical protein